MLACISSYIIYYALCILFILQLVGLGVLIAAATAIPAIDQVKDAINNGILEFKDYNNIRVVDDENDGTFDANGSRGVAVLALLVGLAATVFHFIMLIIRCLYLCSTVEKHFLYYLAMVSIYVTLYD